MSINKKAKGYYPTFENLPVNLRMALKDDIISTAV
jgi:hypothetical protein